MPHGLISEDHKHAVARNGLGGREGSEEAQQEDDDAHAEATRCSRPDALERRQKCNPRDMFVRTRVVNGGVRDITQDLHGKKIEVRSDLKIHCVAANGQLSLAPVRWMRR